MLKAIRTLHTEVSNLFETTETWKVLKNCICRKDPPLYLQEQPQTTHILFKKHFWVLALQQCPETSNWWPRNGLTCSLFSTVMFCLLEKGLESTVKAKSRKLWAALGIQFDLVMHYQNTESRNLADHAIAKLFRLFTSLMARESEKWAFLKSWEVYLRNGRVMALIWSKNLLAWYEMSLRFL